MTTSFNQWREAIRERADLLTIVQQTVRLERTTGRTIMARCPFHDDRGPSLAIYPQQERWHCFGSCNEGGDVFDWIAKREGIDHAEAVRRLAGEFQIEEPQWSPEAAAQRDEREKAQEILKIAADFYHERLLRDHNADAHREYLRARGFGESVWKQWMGGAAGRENELFGHLQAKRIDLKLAERIGLIHKQEGRYYDHFRDRIVIPLLTGGRVVYMTARTIRSEVDPKYLHLKNSEVAQKITYGGGRGRELIVVEGPLDVWALEMIAGERDVAALAMLGLGTNDPTLARAIRHRERVYIGVDSDGTVKPETLNNLVALIGSEKARIVTWPGGDDPAAWLKANPTPEDLGDLLDDAPTWADVLIKRIEAAADKQPGISEAIEAAKGMDPLSADVLIGRIVKAAKGVVRAGTIRKMFEGGTDQPEPAKAANRGAYYRIEEGEIWRGFDPPERITRGGTAMYTELVRVEDGEDSELQLTLEIELLDGRKYDTRLASEDSGDAAAVTKAIKAISGPLLTVEAGQSRHIAQAIDSISMGKMREFSEMARTGWIRTKAGEAFITPEGIVGELPPGYRVKLPEGLERFRVADDGDDAFRDGVDGLVNGFLKAFDPKVTAPALAFGLLPVAAKWMPFHKFALHVSGETGSLKTEMCRILSSLYGDFASTPPLTSWRSTVNSLEQLGFWLPDVMGLVDDYKPRLVKPWEFAELIHRYADGNARMRLDRQSSMRRRQAMRWWMLSNGEDLPTGESSVLARMVPLRLMRRPEGAPYNAELSKAKRLAKYFPTITARWAKWLMQFGSEQEWPARIEARHQQVANSLQAKAAEVPNVNRIARNIAYLWMVWDGFWDFLIESVEIDPKAAMRMKASFAEVAANVSYSAARSVIEEKPTRIFLDTVQEGIDSRRWQLLKRDEQGQGNAGIAGWFDRDGIYLLPAMYNEVSRWMRESGQQIGFSKQELYRLLQQEGLITTGNNDTTIVIHVGKPGDTTLKRVLHFKANALVTPKTKLDEE